MEGFDGAKSAEVQGSIEGTEIVLETGVEMDPATAVQSVKPRTASEIAEFGRLLDLINPGSSAKPETAEEREFVRASRERVRENQKRLEVQLPPSTHADHTRMTW